MPLIFGLGQYVELIVPEGFLAQWMPASCLEGMTLELMSWKQRKSDGTTGSQENVGLFTLCFTHKHRRAEYECAFMDSSLLSLNVMGIEDLF